MLGGWSTYGSASPSQAKWFSHRVTRAEAPWAFCREEPQRVIASLELLAVLYGVVLLISEESDERLRRGAVEVSVGTDNQSNVHLTRKWITTKLPLALVAMELAAQLAKRNIELDLKWRRRDLNQEADSLTNGDFRQFDEGRRVDASRVAGSFLCLPGLVRAWEASKSSGPQRHEKAPPGKRRKLREREPW